MDDSLSSSLLRSHIVPPSHILANGKFIHLPPPSSQERSSFFERSVAEHGLIHSYDDDDDRHGKNRQKKMEKKKMKKHRLIVDNTHDDDDNDDTPHTAKRRRKQHSSRHEDSSNTSTTTLTTPTTTFIHPLVMASARLHSKGLDELNKIINLSGLVLGGEYFGLSHVVVDAHQRTNKNNRNTDSGRRDESAEKATSSSDGGMVSSTSLSRDNSQHGGFILDTMNETISLQEDLRLRSEYVLQRRQFQYENASNVLRRHLKRLSLSVAVNRILDARLYSLRRKWHLVAPEHGKHYFGPIQPREVVTVDVDVYNNNHDNDDQLRDENSPTIISGLQQRLLTGRIPRFATLELDDDYDISTDVELLQAKVGELKNGLKKIIVEDECEGSRGCTSEHDMQVDFSMAEPTASLNDRSSLEETDPSWKTKAEPFSVINQLRGKVDSDITHPEKVSMLTLSFEIEKPSTGFVECATLSSSIPLASSIISNADLRKHNLHHPDELVIEALQHSLFCASLFESIRTEIIPNSSPSIGGIESLSQSRQRSTAWLSSEMEESFLPSPLAMAGIAGVNNRMEDAQQLCVIHCHEGEVKVQLDDEYSLTVKLVAAGSAVSAMENDSSVTDGVGKKSITNELDASGSQSPDELRTLCKSMLHHSQSMYHNYCMMKKRKSESNRLVKFEAPAVGFTRTAKAIQLPSPHILQSCVSLGCKLIFERKVRSVMKRLATWLEKDMQCNETITVEWLSLSLFSPYSRLTILFREVCLDIVIHGDSLRVTRMSSCGYQAVGFGSEMELEIYLKLEFRRALSKREMV